MAGLSVRVLGGLLVGLVILSAPAALGMPRYRLLAAQQLGHDRGDPLWEYSSKVMPCSTCHTQPQGGQGWNTFGESLRAGFREQKGAKFPAVLYAVLQKNADADGDRYPDALEFYARTQPGDAGSVPQKPLAELQAEFEKAGGLKQYAPKTGKK